MKFGYLITLIFLVISTSSNSVEMPQSSDITELAKGVSETPKQQRSFSMIFPEPLSGEELRKIVSNNNLDVIELEGKFIQDAQEMTLVLSDFLSYDASFEKKVIYLLKKVNRVTSSQNTKKSTSLVDRSLEIENTNANALNIKWISITASGTYKDINQILSSNIQGTISFTYKDISDRVERAKKSKKQRKITEPELSKIHQKSNNVALQDLTKESSSNDISPFGPSPLRP